MKKSDYVRFGVGCAMMLLSSGLNAAESANVTDLRAAIAGAAPGATVNVASGTYALEAPLVIDKAITLSGPADRSLVILDGQFIGRCVEITAAATLRNVTVVNGYLHNAGGEQNGGGICATDPASSINNCVIRNCSNETDTAGIAIYGGGVYTMGLINGSSIENCALYRHPAKSSSNNYDSRGGGVYLNGGSLVDSVVSNCVNNAGQTGGEGQSTFNTQGGGVYAKDASVSGSQIIDCRIVLNATASRRDIGSGGGIAMEGGTSSISGSLVSRCYAPCAGAGIVATGGTISYSTISENVHVFDTALGYSQRYDYSAGIEVRGAVTIIGCRIADNRMEEDGTGGSRDYGVAVHFKSAGKLLDSVIENNRSANGGIIALNSSGCLVSNCVIKANVCSNQGAAISCANPASAYGSVVEHCWIADNVGNQARYGSAGYIYGGGTGVAAAGDGKTIIIRNSYITGATQANLSLFNVYNSKNAGFSIESCSFVNNTCSRLLNCDSVTDVSNNSIANSLICNNTIGTSLVSSGVAISNTATDYTDGMSLPDAEGNISIFGNNPLKNSTGGNYALATNSAPVDVGSAVAPDWAARAGETDNGNGKYAISMVNTYGVTIAAERPHARIVGGRIDMGASEWAFEEDEGKEETEPFTPGEVLPVFTDGAAALDAAVAATPIGETVAVPKGIYYFNAPFTMTESMRSFANNREAVIFDFGNASAGIYSSSPVELRGVAVRNCSGLGIEFTNAGSAIKNCVVSNCVRTVTANANGAGVSTCGSISDTVITDCELNCDDKKYLRGAGLYLDGAMASGVTVANCHIRGRSSNVNGRDELAGGGIYAINGAEIEGSLVENCSVSNKSDTASFRAQSYGGGVVLNGSTLRDSIVRGNWAQCGGGGVWGYNAAATIENCTVANNSLLISYDGSGKNKDGNYSFGSGIGLYDGGTIVNTLIAYNSAEHGNDRAGGNGGPLYLAGTATVRDSVVEHNTGYSGLIDGYSPKNVANVTMTNCVMRSNLKGAGRGGMFGFTGGTIMVRDTLITDNTITVDGQPSILLMSLNAGTSAYTFRNCLIARNESTGTGTPMIKFYSSGTPAVTFESCTIVGNNSRKLIDAGNNTAFAEAQSVVNTVYYGNDNSAVANVVADTYTAGCFDHSAVDNAANITCDNTTGNINLGGVAATAIFRNYADGDYSLRAVSPLVNKGITQDWMGNGSKIKKGGTGDIGNGNVAIEYLDCGVEVVRDQIRPRLCDSLPDIGASEFMSKTGFAVIIR